MDNFALAPVAGGKYYYWSVHGYYYGGGGGCVLVNGEGPDRDSVNQGQGYCGGGGRHINGAYIDDGLSGVILIEVGNQFNAYC